MSFNLFQINIYFLDFHICDLCRRFQRRDLGVLESPHLRAFYSCHREVIVAISHVMILLSESKAFTIFYIWRPEKVLYEYLSVYVYTYNVIFRIWNESRPIETGKNLWKMHALMFPVQSFIYVSRDSGGHKLKYFHLEYRYGKHANPNKCVTFVWL